MCESEKERERGMENMFALFTPICLCGSALTSMWAGREAEYAKQLEQRLITLELLCKKKMVHFLDFSGSQTYFVWRKNTGFSFSLSSLESLSLNHRERLSASATLTRVILNTT